MLVGMDFNTRLAQAMEARQCSRATLAKELQVSVQAVGMVLSGDTRALTAENAAKAAKFLGVDYFWLATGEGSMEPRQSWPFPRVSLNRVLALSELDRAYIEGRLEQALEQVELLPMSEKETRLYQEATKGHVKQGMPIRKVR